MGIVSYLRVSRLTEKKDMSKLPRLDHASLIKRSWRKQVENLIRTATIREESVIQDLGGSVAEPTQNHQARTMRTPITAGRRLAKARADLGEREWNLMLLEDETRPKKTPTRGASGRGHGNQDGVGVLGRCVKGSPSRRLNAETPALVPRREMRAWKPRIARSRPLRRVLEGRRLRVPHRRLTRSGRGRHDRIAVRRRRRVAHRRRHRIAQGVLRGRDGWRRLSGVGHWSSFE